MSIDLGATLEILVKIFSFGAFGGNNASDAPYGWIEVTTTEFCCWMRWRPVMLWRQRSPGSPTVTPLPQPNPGWRQTEAAVSR